jgi:hypothetical protein
MMSRVEIVDELLCEEAEMKTTREKKKVKNVETVRMQIRPDTFAY